MKAFVNLLAGKYGETKTAVVAIVDKALAALVANCYQPIVQG